MKRLARAAGALAIALAWPMVAHAATFAPGEERFTSGQAHMEVIDDTGTRTAYEMTLSAGTWLQENSVTGTYLLWETPEGFFGGGAAMVMSGPLGTGTFDFTTPTDGTWIAIVLPGKSTNYTPYFTSPGGGCVVTINGIGPDGSSLEGITGTFQCNRLGFVGGTDGQIDASGTFSASPSGPGPSAPPVTASPSAFGVGIGCGVREDAGLRLLACTASPFGQAADAELTYEWRLDGVTRPETGSTMQVDIVSENLPAGSHAIGVTVTDTRNNVQATNSAAVDTTTAAFAVSVSCGYAESRGTYDLACSAAAANPPPGADLSYTWTINGAPDRTTGATLARSVGQGPVHVTVSARDSVSGQQTNIAAFFLTINPVGTLTNLLTLGQTSDPQNVIDALSGTAAVTLVVAAGAAIAGTLAGAAGALGGAGSASPGSSAQPVPAPGAAAPPQSGVVGGDAVESVELVAQIRPEPWDLPEPPPIGQPPPQPPTQAPPSPAAMPPTGPGQTGAQPVGSQAPTSGIPGSATPAQVEDIRLAEELLSGSGESSAAPGASSPTTGSQASTMPTSGSQGPQPQTTGATSTAPTPEQVGEGAADLLAAEAGQLPSANELEKWRTLSGIPDTPEGTRVLHNYLSQQATLQAAGKNPDTDLLLKVLREQAVKLKPPSASRTPSAPNPDKAYEDAANLLEQTPDLGPIEPKGPQK